MKTIFVVDDSDTNLSKAEEALERDYRVLTLPSAEKMFAMLEKIMPDLILLDIEMPVMDGFQALTKLKASAKFKNIPVVFLTSLTDEKTEVRGFEMGVIDFVGKPFSAPVLLNRIKTHLDVDQLIKERTAQIEKLQGGIILTLADVVENRDECTGGHIERTVAYVRILTEALLARGIYKEQLAALDFDTFVSSARLHDIGKVSIPDSILNKPGKLTDEEFAVMKTHTVAGERIIDQMVENTGEAEFLDSAKQFAVSHHERWDGFGYPRKLKETDIPIHGRIMAIADVYDALISPRPYKDPFPHEQAVQIIVESAGKQFDPEITKVFIEVKDKFADVANHRDAGSAHA